MGSWLRNSPKLLGPLGNQWIFRYGGVPLLAQTEAAFDIKHCHTVDISWYSIHQENTSSKSSPVPVITVSAWTNIIVTMQPGTPQKQANAHGASWSGKLSFFLTLYRFSSFCEHAASTPACLHLISFQFTISVGILGSLLNLLYWTYLNIFEPHISRHLQSHWASSLNQCGWLRHWCLSTLPDRKMAMTGIPCRLQEVLPQQMNSTYSTHLIAQLVPSRKVKSGPFGQNPHSYTSFIATLFKNIRSYQVIWDFDMLSQFKHQHSHLLKPLSSLWQVPEKQNSHGDWQEALSTEPCSTSGHPSSQRQYSHFRIFNIIISYIFIYYPSISRTMHFNTIHHGLHNHTQINDLFVRKHSSRVKSRNVLWARAIRTIDAHT